MSFTPRREIGFQDKLNGHLVATFQHAQDLQKLLRRGAQAVIDAEDTFAADRDLVAAYRRQPTEPALVRSAAGLAARTAPEW